MLKFREQNWSRFDYISTLIKLLTKKILSLSKTETNGTDETTIKIVKLLKTPEEIIQQPLNKLVNIY